MTHLRLAAAAAIALTATSAISASAQPSLVAALIASAENSLRTVEQAAELMPASDFAFRPSPGVRTFGQLIGHVADANRAFCSAIAGARQPVAAAVETTVHGKRELVEALKTANTACAAAFAGLSDAGLPAPRAFGGGALVDGTTIPVRDLPAGQLLALIAAHTEREYGKLTVYLRARGLVPPTSQPRGR